MEKEEMDGMVAVPPIAATNSAPPPPPPPPYTPPSKKRGVWSLFQAALFTARRHGQPDRKALDPPAGTHSIWRNLLCGMRPLHLQHLECCPPPPELVNNEFFHDTPLPPPSPPSSEDAMSRYASAEDLQALDKSNDHGHDEDATGTESRISHSIDMRAEEFIARFYEQIKLQRSDSCGDQE